MYREKGVTNPVQLDFAARKDISSLYPCLLGGLCLRILAAALLWALVALAPLAAQSDAAQNDADQSDAARNDAAAGGGEAEALARGFNNILLGMGMERVKEELESDPNFHFRGDPDVSMMRSPNTSLIETRGYYYIDRASFQFIEDALYTITIILNTNRIGHYAMFTSLIEKYGEPDSLSPQKTVWEDEKMIITLERPLRVKYMAKEVLEELRREQRKKKSAEELTRERFLEQF